MQYTIEEKVIERAYKKLALDALVIQQGRLAEQKSKHLYWELCLIFFHWLIQYDSRKNGMTILT